MKLRYAFACLLVIAVETSAIAAATPTPGAAIAMADAAARFVDLLSEAEATTAIIPFDDPRRLDWHNIPKPQRKGLELKAMSPPQRDACHALLKTALSESGYQRLARILALENNLREGEKNLANGQIRDPERYFLTIFGTPGAKERWGWSFEGHHLSLNFTMADGEVASDTPSFWGANPATVYAFVPGGPEVGVRTLADEEQFAFDLLHALDDGQRAVALVADKAPQDYRAAGRPQPPHTAPKGLPAAQMTAEQRTLLRKTLASYCGQLAPELGQARQKRLERDGIERVHFAWYGAQQPGAGHAYRIQGPSFVVEFVNVQSDPAGRPANHIHSVWRSLEGDFGVHAD